MTRQLTTLVCSCQTVAADIVTTRTPCKKRPFKRVLSALTLASLLGLWQFSPSEARVDYTGHKVLRVHFQTMEQAALLNYLQEEPQYNIDVWSESQAANHQVDLHVGPDVLDNVTQQISDGGMTYDVLIEDMQQLIDHEDDPYPEEDVGEFFPLPLGVEILRRKNTTRSGRKRRSTLWSAGNRRLDYFYGDELDFFWLSPIGRYAQFDDIATWLRTIPNYQPTLARVLDIGYSFEGRSLRVVKIGGPGVDKPAIWVDGGIHAREWISPATAVCLIHILVALYGQDDSVTNLVNAYDWYILPVINPDGYVYSHTTDRMWRKTTSFSYSTYNTVCRGVDLNRNFGFHWQGHCAGGPSPSSPHAPPCPSRRPCDNTYAGQAPFSEMEAIAVANFVLRRRSRLKMFVSLHAYGQLWLIPWLHSGQQPADYGDLVRLANTSIEALRAVYGTSYSAGTSDIIQYSAGGTSADWAKAMAGIKYSYTIELRDTGSYGFLLPRRYIVPVCEETWEAIKTAAFELLNEL